MEINSEKRQGKTDYSKSPSKRMVRSFFIPIGHNKTLVTLGGPNPEHSIQEAQDKKFKKVISYEVNLEVHQEQLKHQKEGIKFLFGDILNAPLRKGHFYDLDFCLHIYEFEAHLKKFKDYDFMITVPLRDRRGFRKKDVIDFFMKCMGHDSYEMVSRENLLVLESGDQKYIGRSYSDGTPMLTIKKL